MSPFDRFRQPGVRRVVVAAVAGIAAAVIAGCATVTGSRNQQIYVYTLLRSGEELVGAGCELTNEKGTWFVVTPGPVSVRKADGDLHIYCNKRGLETGRAAIVSDPQLAMFANAIKWRWDGKYYFGGPLGALIDFQSGAGYSYPTTVRVIMGESYMTTASNPADLRAFPGAVPAAGSQKPEDKPADKNAAKADAGKEANVTAAPPPSREARLRELRKTYQAGLITEEAYTRQQLKILETSR